MDAFDLQLSTDLKPEVEVLSGCRSFGLNFEPHVPESVELTNRPCIGVTRPGFWPSGDTIHYTRIATALRFQVSDWSTSRPSDRADNQFDFPSKHIQIAAISCRLAAASLVTWILSTGESIGEFPSGRTVSAHCLPRPCAAPRYDPART